LKASLCLYIYEFTKWWVCVCHNIHLFGSIDHETMIEANIFYIFVFKYLKKKTTHSFSPEAGCTRVAGALPRSIMQRDTYTHNFRVKREIPCPVSDSPHKGGNISCTILHFRVRRDYINVRCRIFFPTKGIISYSKIHIKKSEERD